MGLNVGRELAALRKMTPKQLRERYAAVHGEASRSGNKDFLVKRIIWRMQAMEQGDLPERARQIALEIANDADLRQRAPSPDVIATIAPRNGRTQTTRISPPADSRLPMPGTVLTREYRGRTITVRVLEKGFEFEGEEYRSLSAVAKAVTGAHWNGYLFFGFDAPKKGKKS